MKKNTSIILEQMITITKNSNMTEFVFRVKLLNGATLNYALRANEKLDAFAAIQKRFPSIAGESVQD